MSILIRGMEMPKRCFECIFLTTVPNFFCLAGKRDLCAEHGINTSRPDWCPLVELPPHGRLIDADELLEKAYWDYNEATRDYNNFKVVSEYGIADAHTVVEAE